MFAAPPAPPLAHGVLQRRYREGEVLVYRMKASNQGRPYQALASGVVQRDSNGIWIEVFAWSDLVFNGAAVNLPPSSVAFRQTLSLDPRRRPAIPNLAIVHPLLIGPITDLLTFYSDLWLAARAGLNKAGDHAYHAVGTPASWADGHNVVLGEDSIDFDIKLVQVDTARRQATLVVRHVPPQKPQIKLPALWMREPVAGTPNNWVEVTRKGKSYEAAVGQETFDVQLSVSLADGKIVSATMENPVTARVRECQDEALENCGTPHAHDILRRVEISLLPGKAESR
jgi:hypothetical protein